jgi:hypothetical protein
MRGCIRNYRFHSAIPGLMGVLFATHTLFAGFGISVEPEIGFKTNVASGTNDSLKNRAFVSAGIMPSWSFDSTNDSRYIVSSAADICTYGRNSAREFRLEPKITAIKNSTFHTTTLCCGVSYSSIAAVNDPTFPHKFAEYSFLFERKGRHENPMTVSYGFSILDDVASPRIDFKNNIKLKWSWKVGSGVRLFVKPGILWDLSNTSSGSFLQPLLFAGGFWLVNTKDLLSLQMYAGFPFYEQSSMLLMKNKNRKPGNSPDNALISQPRIPISMIFFGYSREITGFLDLLCNYDFTAFDPGEGKPLYSSHKISVGVEWQIF